MKKIIYIVAKTLHLVLPNYILMNFLAFIQTIPILRKLVLFFDPNLIRKNVNFDMPEKLIFLRNSNWNLKVNSSDHIGFRSYLKNEPFEMAIYKLADKIHPSGRRIIIDIGANIGSASIPICKKYGYELIAIEASKCNIPLLAENVLNNELKARILPYALVDEVREDYITIFINKGNTGANSLLEKWNPSLSTNYAKRLEYVPTKTLDQIIKEEKIDVGSVLITKIDVEGMEEAVLSGAIEFLAVNDAPIIFEYRLDAVRKYLDKDMQRILDIFKSFDYLLYVLTDDGSVANFDPGLSYENIIAIKQGHELEYLM